MWEIMRENFKEKLSRYGTRVVITAVLIGGAMFTRPKYQQERSLKIQESELDERIEAKKAEIEKLREKQRRFQTDREYVELIAREYSHVYPGELVFEFAK